MIRRVLAVNVLALGILVAGLLFLGKYRDSLTEAELESLRTQAEMFAVALAEGAVARNAPEVERLLRETADQMVRRLVTSTGTRARLFSPTGALVADSRLLIGPGGAVQVEELAPPSTLTDVIDEFLAIYQRLAGNIAGGHDDDPDAYHENPVQHAGDYPEVLAALNGDVEGRVRPALAGGRVLTVAVPVQHYKQVLGALMLSKGSRDIDNLMLQVRLNILKVFAVSFAVTVLLSLYLGRTIARPIRRLAAAAERIRRSRDARAMIPEFAGRDDEIGDLARALSDMTKALRQRMVAIERFAADVAHEIKNPLTSLRSAVETAARVEDPEQRKKLMAIVLQDVGRLDRLISDIANASRLDAEMSRAEVGPADVGRMLETLIDIHATTAGDGAPTMRLERTGELTLQGLEDRLGQVFRNLLVNAISFSPPGGVIEIRAKRDDGLVVVEIDDDGPGIPEGKETAIFERFYSARPEGETFGTHSGLGLSISAQIVEAHGGTIHAENRRRADGTVAGARFVVRLPVESEGGRKA